MVKAKAFQGVMVSSTFTDLESHRQAVINALRKFELLDIVMENSGARADVDVIDSSLGMVRKSAAYIGLISHKYGQTPECARRNPKAVSITELEFDEAMRLGRPILLFIMSEEHPVKPADFEVDEVKRAKLNAFKTRAKQMRADSTVSRVYEVFVSPEDLAVRATAAIGHLAEYLKQQSDLDAGGATVIADDRETPEVHYPPELRAVPRYLGSHALVGRAAELDILDDWSGEADPNPVLLFEAMGGSGKSTLTWDWITKRAVRARSDWAGRFWYSFYERGALMEDFCRQALSYITSQPVEEFARMRARELADRLVAELERRPWLLALDGMERVLVRYHRSDAAQLRDEEADLAEDPIGKRDPLAAIRPEDDDLLRRLAAVAPSKILITSRLLPRALLNRAGSCVPGVRRELLSGLRPADAEELIRACGVAGGSKAIRAYLQANCDCHPLVVGALAGLINDYLPARGDFDAWVKDIGYGGALNLAHLDLLQRRHHILEEAMKALTPEGQKLLETIALLQQGADFELLTVFNPHMPPEPEFVEEPENPEASLLWRRWGEKRRAMENDNYKRRGAEHASYLGALSRWRADPNVLGAPGRLAATVRDLEKRGLLQYDSAGRRYDLHPVVRGIAFGRMDEERKRERGAQVVNYFNAQSHSPWEEVTDLQDVMPGLQLVTTLTQIGRFEEAASVLSQGLIYALHYSLEAHAELQALLKPFFPGGWEAEIVPLRDSQASMLFSAAAACSIDSDLTVRFSERGIHIDLERDSPSVSVEMRNVAIELQKWRLFDAERVCTLSLNLAKSLGSSGDSFVSTLYLYNIVSDIGDFDRADELWTELAPIGRDWSRGIYRQGEAEYFRALDRFRRGDLTEEQLIEAEVLVRNHNSRFYIRSLAALRGEYYLTRGEIGKAVRELELAVRMARDLPQGEAISEALLALARLRLGEGFDARAEAEQLDNQEGEAALPVAELWYEFGERDRAISAALRAHKWAVASGEPYVHRFELNRVRALLSKLGAELPDVPAFDPATSKPFSWEKDVEVLIERIKADKRKE